MPVETGRVLGFSGHGGNRVPSAGIPGITSQYSSNGEPETSEESVPDEGNSTVLAAGGVETA